MLVGIHAAADLPARLNTMRSPMSKLEVAGNWADFCSDSGNITVLCLFVLDSCQMNLSALSTTGSVDIYF